jgi:hypothetical protein
MSEPPKKEVNMTHEMEMWKQRVDSEAKVKA